MPKFAKIDENNVVQSVIVATPKFIRTISGEDSSTWVEVDIHGTTRNRFPGIGWFYDNDTDNFYPPKPYPSWIWQKNEILGFYSWAPPVPFPGTPENGIAANWDEDSQTWIEIPGHFDDELQRFVPD